MKKILISFANEKYYPSLSLLEKTSIEIGRIDEFKKHTQSELKTTEFWDKNKYILMQSRGAGYWIWKPYLLLKAFEEMTNNDVVMYSDAGISVIDDLTPLFEIAYKKERVIFQIPGGHLNRTFTKMDCFNIMGCSENKYLDGIMVNGAISLWKKSDQNKIYLEEWLKWCRNPAVVTDLPSLTPNLTGFKDHRHDQSILSLMSIKYEWERFRDPTQWGVNEKSDNGNYGVLMNHHRGKLK
ncbi:MAG: hypothetical protein HC831_11770 [Chloroflexia bacterium]|nr:hypothetical protein [Chloroflexia bacterium]